MGNFGIIFLIGHSQCWESFPEFPFPQSEFPQRAVRVYMCLVSRLLWQRLIGPRDQSHWSGMSNGRDGTSAYDAHKGLVLDEYEFADLNASVETFWEGQNVRDSGAGSCSPTEFSICILLELGLADCSPMQRMHNPQSLKYLFSGLLQKEFADSLL